MTDYSQPWEPGPEDPLLNLPKGVDLHPTLIEQTLRDWANRLNDANPLKKLSQRARAIQELKDCRISGATDLVNAAINSMEKKGDGGQVKPEKATGQGRKIEFKDVEPWPEPVDGAELLEGLSRLFSKYIVLPVGGTVVLALWVLHTYLIDAFEHTGYLGIVSAARECGKTTTLQLVSALVCRPTSTGNITAASLFRVVEEARPTLVIDELDRVPADSDVWQLLNDGFRRTGGVIRTVGDSHEPRFFSTWSSKALGFIRKARTKIPDTVLDRTLFVELSRKKKTEHRARLRTRVLSAEAAPLRRQLNRWAADHAEAIARAEPALPDDLNDREADCWEPLLAIADAVGGGWPERAREVSCSQSSERAEDEADDWAVLVLLDLLELLDSGDLTPDEHGLAAESMVQALKNLEDRPWRTLGKDEKGISTQALARFLRPHRLRPKPAGPKNGRVRRYDPAAVRDMAERFQKKRTPAHASESAPASDSAVKSVRVCASSLHTGGAESAIAPHSAASQTDRGGFVWKGHRYRQGDQLPDGRKVLEIVDGCPILSKAPARGQEAGA